MIVADDGTEIVKAGLTGPNLYGVVGRVAGRVAGWLGRLAGRWAGFCAWVAGRAAAEA